MESRNIFYKEEIFLIGVYRLANMKKSVFDTKCEVLGTFSGFLYDECDGVTAWNTHKLSSVS